MISPKDMWIMFVAFSSTAALTWFFSSRPRFFVRVFAPPDDLRVAARGILRDANFGRGMRTIALLQFSVAVLFGVIGLCLTVAQLL